jgi:hypothetical protein
MIGKIPVAEINVVQAPVRVSDYISVGMTNRKNRLFI